MAKAAKGVAPDRAARALLDELERKAGTFGSPTQLKGKPAAKPILAADPQVQAAVVMEAIRGVGALREKIDGSDPPDLFNVHHVDGYAYAAVNIVPALLTPKVALTDAQVVEVLREVARFEHIAIDSMPFLPALCKYLEQGMGREGFPKAARPLAREIAGALLTMEGAAETRLSKRFAALAAGPVA